ncbi:DUF6382 domain-containing protein [Paenibacillus thailandensis]|uniref:DUF6382 domain-containing protein n=1 Tax=Paenibacillus thailandensis TaxID=393250 RepID=A0ABW5QWW1_9BACL
MDRFRIDFSMSRGHEMIVDREQGIRRDQLAQVELQMLQNCRPPQLLPVEWFEMDGLVTFRYALNGKKMLAHRLQLQSITMQQFYSMLLAVVEALEECKHYMLRPEGCLLNERFLFVGEQLTDIQLAYMPTIEAGLGPNSDFGDLLSLIVSWSANVADIDGAGLQRILQMASGQGYPCRELRSLLLELIGGHSFGNSIRPGGSSSLTEGVPKRTQAQRSYDPPVQELYEGSGLAGLRPGEEKEPRRRQWMRDEPEDMPHFGKPWPSATMEAGIADEENEGTEGYGEYEENGASIANEAGDPHRHIERGMNGFDEIPSPTAGGPSKSKWIRSAFIALALAIAWRYLYIASPGRNSLYICLGLSMLGLACLFFIWLRKPKDAEAEYLWDSDGSEEEFDPVSRLLAPKASRQAEHKNAFGRYFGKEHPGSIDRSTTPGGEVRVQALPGWKAEEDNENPDAMDLRSRKSELVWAAASSEMRDADKVPDGGIADYSDELTVMLGSEADRLSQGRGKMALYREWKGKEERLSWNGGPYIVGRAGDQVSYVESAAGISRLHLEIESTDDEKCRVKDLGSRNGSLLNGEAMIPYKIYSITVGDVVQLAGAEGPKYSFRRE